MFFRKGKVILVGNKHKFINTKCAVKCFCKLSEKNETKQWPLNQCIIENLKYSFGHGIYIISIFLIICCSVIISFKAIRSLNVSSNAHKRKQGFFDNMAFKNNQVIKDNTFLFSLLSKTKLTCMTVSSYYGNIKLQAKFRMLDMNFFEHRFISDKICA